MSCPEKACLQNLLFVDWAPLNPVASSRRKCLVPVYGVAVLVASFGVSQFFRPTLGKYPSVLHHFVDLLQIGRLVVMLDISLPARQLWTRRG